jgi:hypothetical protein
VGTKRLYNVPNQDESSEKYWYCECGCGRKTQIAKRTITKSGWIKGKPKRFLVGHNSRYIGSPPDVPNGKKWCGECKQIKDVSEFYSHRNTLDGLQGRCKDCGRKYHKKWRENNPEYDKKYMDEYHLLIDFGLTTAQYNKMLEDQEGRCAICYKYETRMQNGKLGRMSVDHDHKTGKIRGLLCNNCNRALGLLGDCIGTLQTAIDYLKLYRNKEEVLDE